jgi:E3 ubiquitin-protein ligase RNF1/2
LIGVVPNAEIAERWESRIKRKFSRRDRSSTPKGTRAGGRKEKRISLEISSDLKHRHETYTASNSKLQKPDEQGGPSLSLDLTVAYGPEIPTVQDERNEAILAPAPDLYHPDSRWQEPKPHIPQPTLYEKHRNPRPAPSGTVVCSLKALQQEFRCVICLGYIQNARLVVQCNHRFCGDCIERLLSQVGQRKECPICRTHIPSRRSLAPDPSFDRLIHKILPSELIVSEIDEEHVVTQNLNVENKNLQKAIELKKQAEALRKAEIADGTIETVTEPSDLTEQPNFTPPLIKIELMLREKEGLMQVEPLRMPFVTISGDATILVLKSFIIQKYGFLSGKVQIWSILDSRPTPLEDAMSLHFVATHWADEYFGSYMPLYYGFE